MPHRKLALESSAMILRDITARMRAAAEAEDLDALEQTLADRGALVAAVQKTILAGIVNAKGTVKPAGLVRDDTPTPAELAAVPAELAVVPVELAAVIEDGEKALGALMATKQGLQAQYSRLTQLRGGLAMRYLEEPAMQNPQHINGDVEITVPILWDQSSTDALRGTDALPANDALPVNGALPVMRTRETHIDITV